MIITIVIILNEHAVHHHGYMEDDTIKKNMRLAIEQVKHALTSII